jgi:hypothetical protein
MLMYKWPTCVNLPTCLILSSQPSNILLYNAHISIFQHWPHTHTKYLLFAQFVQTEIPTSYFPHFIRQTPFLGQTQWSFHRQLCGFPVHITGAPVSERYLINHVLKFKYMY